MRMNVLEVFSGFAFHLGSFVSALLLPFSFFPPIIFSVTWTEEEAEHKLECSFYTVAQMIRHHQMMVFNIWWQFKISTKESFYCSLSFTVAWFASFTQTSHTMKVFRDKHLSGPTTVYIPSRPHYIHASDNTEKIMMKSARLYEKLQIKQGF